MKVNLVKKLLHMNQLVMTVSLEWFVSSVVPSLELVFVSRHAQDQDSKDQTKIQPVIIKTNTKTLPQDQDQDSKNTIF